jgi:peptide subunit release factor 1 (eRF1)
LIPDSDLEILRSFDGRGNVTLSAYLRLDTPQSRESAYSEFMKQMQVRLEDWASDPEVQKALGEDMEIIGLYLQSNGHRRHAGMAIFSCAARLFWRAFPLSSPLPTRVTVGPRFDLEPLMSATTQPA